MPPSMPPPCARRPALCVRYPLTPYISARAGRSALPPPPPLSARLWTLRAAARCLRLSPSLDYAPCARCPPLCVTVYALPPSLSGSPAAATLALCARLRLCVRLCA